jgi:hypothetical protein
VCEGVERLNSAKRLYRILKGALNDGADDALTSSVILAAMVMPVETQLYRLTDFFELLSIVERDLEKLKEVEDIDEYLRIVRDIKELFIANPINQTTWSTFKSNLAGRNLILPLSAIAQFLEQEYPQRSLEQKQLDEFLSEFEILLQEVHDSDLEEKIKTYLIVRLEEICSAIRHYNIGGPERLRLVVEANIGGLLLRVADITSQDKENPVFKKYLEKILTFGGLLDTASNIQGYLLPMLKGLFLPSSN